MHSKDNTFEWVFCFKTSSAYLYFIEHFLAHFQDNHKSGFNIVGFMITFKHLYKYTCLLIFLDHYSLYFEYQICKYCVAFWKIFKINWSILHGFWLLIFYTKLILRELCHFILNTRASFHVWSLFTTKCMLCFCYSCLEHPFAISRSSFCHSNAHSISNFVSCSSSMQQHITHNAYINENMQYKGRKRTIVVRQKDTTFCLCI